MTNLLGQTPATEVSTAAVPTGDGTQPLNEGEDLTGQRVDAIQEVAGIPAEEEKTSVERELSESAGHDQTKPDGAGDGTFNMGFNMNASGFPNLMNMNMPAGFNNAMDYSQMMQYMSANGMGNLTNMMGS